MTWLQPGRGYEEHGHNAKCYQGSQTVWGTLGKQTFLDRNNFIRYEHFHLRKNGYNAKRYHGSQAVWGTCTVYSKNIYF